MRHNIGLYIRVSTEEQAQVIEGSLDTQRHRLLSYVDLKNLQESNWGKVVDTYSDEGLSAKDTKRPAFQRMMKDIKSGKVNLILVTDLSRLSRNILDFCILLEDLKKANAKFLSLKEQFDTSTPAGEMMVFNMINLAQFERKQTSERVSMNFHARALRGLRNGGGIVLGFDVDPTHPGRYIVNAEEENVVRLIFEIYREECSLRKTIRRLEKLGIKPKRREARNDGHNLAGRWTIDSLSCVLKNYAYAGLREVNAKNKNKDQEYLRPYEKYQIVKAAWDAIIEEKTFFVVQKIKSENLAKERKRLEAASSRTFLLSGKIYCEECGRPLIGTSGHGRTRIHRYYVHRKIHGVPVLCAIKTINAEAIEERVLNHIDEVLFREGYFDALEKRLYVVYRQAFGGVKSRISNLEADVAQIDREVRSTIKLISEMKEDGMEEVLKDALKKLKNQRLEAVEQLEESKAEQIQISNASEDRKVIELNAQEIKKLKTRANPAILKRLLHKLISAISISPDGAKVGYWTPCIEKNLQPSIQNKLASPSKGGAILSFNQKHRFLKKIQDYNNIPPSPFGPGVLEVFGGYIVGNGRTDWN